MDYRQLAYQTAQKYGIDPDLFVRQIQAESAFRPDAVSSAGAIGLGQLMPATAKELGVDPTDPVQNLEGAARYMKQQLDRFGDPALALAAYNAGPSRVAKANGVPNITETQNYVAKILGGKGGAAMAQEPQKPQGLLGGLLGGQGIGERLGLSPEFSDKLAMAVMAGSGDARLQPLIQQRAAGMKERRAETKELKRRNKSLDYLTKKADAGDDLAAQYLGVISTGAVDAGSGLASYLKASTATDSSSSAFGEKFNIYKKAMPDASDMQILEKMNEKDLPATFEALDMTARAAGFKPKTEGGDGQYEEFMAGQGAGFKRAAQNLADMNFEQLQEYTKTLGKADRTTKLIDQIKSSQYLDGVLGRVEGKIPVSSWLSLGVFDQDETDLIQLIDNLENSVFLEAFQELKGGGQITELEGEKAQRAIVNLNRDRSKKAFLDALDTLQSVIDAGVGRAKRGVSVNNPYTKDLVVGGNGGSAKPAASGERGAANQPVVIDGYSIVKVE
jgi:hypothetical protein